MNDLAPIESLSQALKIKEPEKPTLKQRKALAEAQAFAKFGVHALRVKSKVIAALGREAEDAGIKHLGHGKVIVASGYAEEAIAKLQKTVDQIAAQEKPDFKLIVELMRLIREFNTQLITTAQVHLNMAKAIPADQAPSLNIPFPAGSPLMIAVGHAPPVSH